jgi:hypothetical protein
MNDADDTELKTEIDEIMRNINEIMDRIENLDPVKNSNASRQNED